MDGLPFQAFDLKEIDPAAEFLLALSLGEC
jgi:hypothetical protein